MRQSVTTVIGWRHGNFSDTRSGGCPPMPSLFVLSEKAGGGKRVSGRGRQTVPMFMKLSVAFAGALLLAACAGPGVDKAVGGGAAETPVEVHTSESAVTVENRTGRALLNVRVAIDATGAPAAFVRTIPSIEPGQTMNLLLTDFRTEEGVIYDPFAAAPARVTVKARDTLTNSYEVTAVWP